MANPTKVKDTGSGEPTVQYPALAAPVANTQKTVLSAQSITPTAAQLGGGNIEHVSVTGAGTCTLDTGANMDTAFPSFAVGDSFLCTYTNTGTQTATLTTAAGITLKGATVAITTGKTALLQFRKTGAATWDCFIIASA
jgi:hypothetical protein